jgi:GntR family transcriptional regulator, transcriptional repressor for pyruvate dehydrogenase complex
MAPAGAASAPADEIQIRPYSPLSRKEEVDLRIKEYIATNELRPGDRLPGESWFAEQLGVGRPLIREAFRGLEAVGVIETRKGVGRFVSTFEADSYLSHFTAEMLLQSFSERELDETRCLLEIAVVSNAVERLTDQDLDQIRAHLLELREQARLGQRDRASDLGMHRTIMGRSDNRIIAALLDAVYSLATTRDLPSDGNQMLIEQDLREHEAIAAAALRRDGPATRAALIAHFETTAQRMGFEPLWRGLYGGSKEAATHFGSAAAT